MQTEEHVQAFLERNLPSTFGGEPRIPEKKTRLHCRFSWESFKEIIYKRFPVLNWLFSYQFREWILKDLHAGLNVGLVQVPQETRVLCEKALIIIMKVDLWSSGLLGSFSILNLVVKNILKSLDLNKTLSFNSSLVNFSDPTVLKGYMETLRLTASVTFMTGIIQLLLGCFCLKHVTAYLPKALIDAYLSAAALLVIVSQFTFIFDVVLDFHRSSRDVFCIITATITANCVHLHAESSSAVVSGIPQRFLPPTLPDLSNLRKIILHAFSLATISCFLLVFIGEKYALLHNYNISSSQELIAVGLCNICSALFRSFPVSCAISGTVIQEKTGGRTQLAALMGASIMLVIALKLGHFFWVIPNSVLAAIVVFNMRPFLEKFLDIPTLWRKDKYHLVPYTEKLVKSCHTDSTSTSSSVNLVCWSKYGVRQNCGMLLLGAANAKSASPGINTRLQPEKNEDDEGQQAGVSPGSAVGNTSAQLDREEQSVHLPGPVHTIILDFSMVQFVDLQGSDLLRQIFHMFSNIGITVLIAGCHSSVIAAFEKNELFDSCVTKEMFFLTLHDALLAALVKHQKPDERELTTEENAEKLQAKDETVEYLAYM
ncbi:hypothetical protein CIB84_000768 [Bambusicola thoracicus]|uniref:STAS domain-containing protein n=1 Tax=Bambusicola thoracicus TaxID=9083 RepID=A0A2P4TGJ3_BAMTH|nr:hypothetical protein CIB84_000768 [Bambusicola thoracicus]